MAISSFVNPVFFDVLPVPQHVGVFRPDRCPLHAQPAQDIRVLVFRLAFITQARKQTVQVNADQVFGMMVSPRRRQKPAPVATFNAVVAVPESLGHQPVITCRVMLKAKPFLGRIVGEPKANDRRNDNRKRIFRVTAIRRRVSQHRQNVQQQHERPRVTVHHEQRQGIRSVSLHMNKMYTQTVNVGSEVR